MSFYSVFKFVILILTASSIIASPSKGRWKRSLMDLSSMVNAVTGRDSADFLGYGNWCGLGGNGRPMDPVDQCCQTHDLCYNIASRSRCKDEGEKAVYRVSYSWSQADDGTATCGKSEEGCGGAVCLCDALLANCLRANGAAYKESRRKPASLSEMLEQAHQI